MWKIKQINQRSDVDKDMHCTSRISAFFDFLTLQHMRCSAKQNTPFITSKR